jgi:hypothetical protein
VTLDYFRGELPRCVTCAAPFDWLDVLTILLAKGDSFYGALAPAGARWVVTQITLLPNTNYHLNLADHGVDPDARVLFVNYTPNGPGGLFPIQFHGNVPDRVPRVKSILIPIEMLPPAGPTLVSVFVAWLPANLDASPWAEFVRALEAHVEGDYDAAMVPASAAVEAAVWLLTHAVIDEHVRGKQHVEDFETQMPFADLVNVLIPAFAGVLGQPQMSGQLRGRVNRLRKLRNELAHRGHTEKPITKDESASVLAGALLCHRYCYLVKADLLRRAHDAALG